MNFEKLLAAFDMGICADQIQREALFDLALLFIEIDGVQTSQELEFIQQWVDESNWNGHLSSAEYREQSLKRCQTAIKNNEVEHFIKDKATLLINSSIKGQAIQLAEDIVMVDGQLAEDEAKALKFLKNYLQ